MRLMTQKKRLTLARLAGQYGLKVADADKATEKLGLRLRRGDAMVMPWQETLLRPVLERMKWDKDSRKHTAANAGPVAYEAADEHSGYLDEAPRFGFTNTEMARQLAPILKKMRDEDSG
jgi:hypothetical protein